MKVNDNKQSGFASITVALIMVLVMALMTVGFAQLARREQSSALDRQLAAQAYYAAESGINDTIDATSKDPSLVLSSNNCVVNQNALSIRGYDSTLSGAGSTSYSCVLVNKDPSNLFFMPQASESFNSSFTTSAPLTSLIIKWRSDGKNFPDNPSGGFSTNSEWNSANKAAVLEISLTPTDTAERETLISKSFTVYAYPSKDGGSVDVTSGQAQIIGGNCDAAAKFPCQLAISNLDGSTKGYVIHITSNYASSQVEITGVSGSSPVSFQNAQMTIDVTGKAKDVLKRLQVRRCLGINCGPKAPDYAVQAQNICKRPQVVPEDSSKYIDENDNDVSDGIAGGSRNTGCALDRLD